MKFPINSRYIFLILLILSLSLSAQVFIEKPISQHPTSFAIITDSKTFEKSKEAIYNYRDALESDGLSTYIISSSWTSPDEVKKEIAILYEAHKNLEGLVLVGDIPIVLIRNAQHLTTAFKMNEDKFPFPQSSVPSDRFYDDLHLSFDFISQDKKQPLHFYYKLREDGVQILNPNFYSARIKYPEKRGGDKYKAISDFLNKAASAKKDRNNPLDNIVSFTGASYNSECLTAWLDEGKSLRENFPFAWKTGTSAKQLNFRMDDFMKHLLINELQRPEVDVFMFHEHGMPTQQLINNEPAGASFESRYNILQNSIYSDVRREVSRGKISLDSAKNQYAKQYNFKLSFFDKLYDKDLIKQDSLEQADVMINLSDLKSLSTNPAFVLLDACYNGSFHEDDYVAGYYIFNPGKTLVVSANTRNVLQDRWTEELIGLLSYGARAGQYNRYVATLEGHLIGDPTVRFSTPENVNFDAELNSQASNSKYWEQLLKLNNSVYQSLAIRQLADYDSRKVLSDKFFKVFKESPFSTVRMEALTTLSNYNDANFTEAVVLGLNDSYELVARQAANYAGEIGDEKLILPLVNAFLNSSERKRVLYNIQAAFGQFPADKLLSTFNATVSASNLINKKNVEKEISDFIIKGKAQIEKSHNNILNRSLTAERRVNDIRSIRNYNYHYHVDDYLKILNDSNEDEKVRVALAEALGWFNHSYRKNEIVQGLKKVSAKKDLPQTLKLELIQTINRLK